MELDLRSVCYLTDLSLINGRQLRAARVLLGWDQQRLAKAAGVAIGTVRRMEASDGRIGGTVDTLRKVEDTLQAHGIEFLNGGLPGVRMKH